MPPETPNRINPLHRSETFFDGETTFITENPPGGLPLDSAEVIEREKKRREELAKRIGKNNQPSE